MPIRCAFIADVHGNAVALRACLKELERRSVDRVFFLGDAVGYFPACLDVLRMLHDVRACCVKGNHEAMLTGTIPVDETKACVYRHDLARTILSQKELDYIGEWPILLETMLDGKRLLLVHGSPQDYLCGYVYPTEDFSSWPQLPWEIVVMGHTHHAFVKRHNKTILVNPGSVGLPRDHHGCGSFAIVESTSVEIIRIPLDPGQILHQYGNSIHASVRERFLVGDGRIGR